MRRRGNAAQWVLVYTIQVKIKMHGLLCIDDLMYRQQVSKVYIPCIPEYQTFERAEREGFKEPAIASAIARYSCFGREKPCAIASFSPLYPDIVRYLSF